MMNVKLCTSLATAAAIALLAACAGTGTDAGSKLAAPTSAARVLTTASVGDAGNNVVNQGEVEVCKYGTAASFEVGPTGGTAATVNLADGECKVVVVDLSTSNPATSYTIREVPSASYALQSIQRTDIQFIGSSTTDQTTGPAPTTDPVVALINAYHGVHLVYHNNPVVQNGCTYTQGWYKNEKHVWPSGTLTRTSSFDGGANLVTILHTAPKGNVYYILAHQYITALLNIQGGASSSDITQALADAADYFADASVANPLPAGWTKDEVTAIATILDEYNNGIRGPGHCDDEILTVQ